MLYFEKYANKGKESSMNIVKNLAFDMSIEPTLLTKIRSFKVVFSPKDLSDFDANDLLSELKVLQVSLSNMMMSVFEIIEFVKATNYYSNVLIVYQILLTMSLTVAFA